MVEFIQESVFVRLKPVAEMESEFDVWFWKMYSLSIPSDRWIFDRVKTALKLKNVKIVVICIPLPSVYLIIIQKLSTSVFFNF